jgi:hypothetical protein
MKRRLAIIAAIVRKDVLSHWPVLAGTAVVIVAWGWVNNFGDFSRTAEATLNTVLAPLSLFVTLFTVVILVQQDPAVGSRHDWRTRPASRFDLIVAKHLVIIPAVLWPWLIVLALNGVSQGYSAPEIILHLLTFWPILLFAPLFIAFAATAETIVGFLVMSAATAVVLGVSGMVFNAPYHELLGQTSAIATWINAWVALLLALILGVGLIAFQFKRSRPWASRGLFLVIVAVAMGTGGRIVPTGAAWSAQAAALPENESSRSITAVAKDVCLTANVVGDAASLAQVMVGDRKVDGFGRIFVGLEGLPSGGRLAVDMQTTRLDQTGTLFVPQVSNGLIPRREEALGVSRRYVVGESDLRALAEGGGRIKTDLKMSLLEPTETFEIPLDGRRRWIGGFGWCSAARMEGMVASVRVDCFKVGRGPNLVDFTDPTGSAQCVGCGPNYTPAPLRLGPGVRYSETVINIPHDASKITAQSYKVTARLERTAEFSGPVGLAQACPAGGDTAEVVPSESSESGLTIRIGG